jgi:cAMP phosphodiesterase
MSTIVKKIWTQTLTASSITIDSSYGLVELSIVLLNGTGSVLGTGFAGPISSAPVTLSIGVGLNLGSGSSNALIDGLTITTTGVIALVGR